MNSNVFYEIGIAHVFGKNVIIITSNEKDIPFDIHHIRHLLYQNTPRAMKQFEEDLRAFLMEIYKNMNNN